MPTDPPTRPHPVVEYLAHRDVPCPGCNYNLRGLQTPSCPECGRVLAIDDIRIPRRRLSELMAGRLLCLIVATVLPLPSGPLDMQSSTSPLPAAFFLLVVAGSIAVAAIEWRAAGPRARGTTLAAAAPTITWCWIVLLLVVAALSYGIELTRMYR